MHNQCVKNVDSMFSKAVPQNFVAFYKAGGGTKAFPRVFKSPGLARDARRKRRNVKGIIEA